MFVWRVTELCHHKAKLLPTPHHHTQPAIHPPYLLAFIHPRSYPVLFTNSTCTSYHLFNFGFLNRYIPIPDSFNQSAEVNPFTHHHPPYHIPRIFRLRAFPQLTTSWQGVAVRAPA